MDWRQTSNSITLFYQTVCDYPGVSYQVKMINESKLVFRLVFEKDVVTHELQLSAGVEWPPVCKRDLDTMEVSRWRMITLTSEYISRRQVFIK